MPSSRPAPASDPSRTLGRHHDAARARYAEIGTTFSGAFSHMARPASRGAFSLIDLPRVVGYAGLSKLLETYEMARGTVKWFNSQKGYGFIQPQGGGGKDVFVHISAVEKAGLPGLNEGQVVEYEEVSNRGKTSAENLKVQR
jgi:CspA family cold shock protein